ncbi:MAG: uncharacterized protein HW380_211 [Magnetococcales bacterium]|nr:uncharacterized protein [Magnetococcales bacterium]HIJ83833.1 DUF5615 family PIN-like protein [Magnetococcales bacterium]
MKFKVDENLPAEVTALLQNAGHDAFSVQDQAMGGANDGKVFQICREEQRILVTLDLDFANMQAYPPSEGRGIVVLRLAWQDKVTVMEAMQHLLPILASESPDRRLWIVEEERIRIRE